MFKLFYAWNVTSLKKKMEPISDPNIDAASYASNFEWFVISVRVTPRGVILFGYLLIGALLFPDSVVGVSRVQFFKQDPIYAYDYIVYFL